MSNRGYEVEIVNSSKELSPLERVKLKDTSDAIKLDDIIQDDPLVVKIVDYIELKIHNEKSENTDYSVYLIVDENGAKYQTSSENFFDTFLDIYIELKDCAEDWQLKIYKLPSKNYSNKSFLTCSVA